MDDLTPLNLADIAPPEWYAITPDEVDKKYLKALVAKPTRGGYQAGVKISYCRWRWSVKIFDTKEAAEIAAVKKIKQLEKDKRK